MKYTLSDVIYRPLRADLQAKVLNELHDMPDWVKTLQPGHYSYAMRGYIDRLTSKTVKESLEYILASTNVERAKVVLQGSLKKEDEDRIIGTWIKYADQMQELEKILAGWCADEKN